MGSLADAGINTAPYEKLIEGYATKRTINKIAKLTNTSTGYIMMGIETPMDKLKKELEHKAQPQEALGPKLGDELKDILKTIEKKQEDLVECMLMLVKKVGKDSGQCDTSP